MSLIGCATKLSVCLAVAGGLIIFPQSHTLFRQAEKQEYKKTTWILGESNKGSSGLFLEDMEKISQLFAERKKTLTVEEVGMKFGNRALSSKDILISPCEDGKYYLLKYVNNSGRYELKKGLLVSNLWCGDRNLTEDIEYVQLKWAKPISRNRVLSNIYLSDCQFMQSGTSNISIICNKDQRLDRLQFTFKVAKSEKK